MRTYHALRTLQIIVGVSIPVLSLLLRNQLGQNITGVLGAFLAGNEAFLQFRQFPQHWKRWRIAEQDLIREAWLFDQNVGKYSDPNTKKTVLAEAVEKIIAKEHNAWVELHEKTAKGHEESHGKAKASGQ
jgi:hypothetical protein